MRNWTKLMTCVLAALLFAAGCGNVKSSADSAPAAMDMMQSENYYAGGSVDAEEFGYAFEAKAEADTTYETAGTEEPAASVEPIDPVEPEPGEAEIDPAAINEKLVYTCDIAIETLEFQESEKALRAAISKFGGIVASESTWDNDYRWYYDDYRKTSGTLTLSMTVRVPSAKYESFLASLEGVGGKVTNRSMNVKNITKTYNDQSVLIQSLETQEARLNEMMGKAETIEDMIAVEARLTDVQTQLNQARTRLASMDTDVNFSTINLTLEEVVKYTDVTVQRTFAERFVSTFKDSWENFRDFLENLLFLLIYLLPYIAVAALVIAILFAATRNKRMERKEQKKARKAAKEKERAEAGAAEAAAVVKAEAEEVKKEAKKED
ncbi:MAG: DUF4349 domain-containing protein [Lachnospiraceae bacterium]|nr:DUF4349 domain-containing protein [Lachnospiraceae bacterium]